MAERPRAGDPPILTGNRELLQKLLDIEIERLETARNIEKKREIVFPETSVIVRDILKIRDAINGKSDVAAPERDALDELMA